MAEPENKETTNRFRKIETKTEINQVLQTETHTQRNWLLPAALALGLLLIVGGLLTLVRGLQKSDETIADLPEYTPAFVSPATSPSPSTDSSPVASPTPTEDAASTTPTPAVESPLPTFLPTTPPKVAALPRAAKKVLGSVKGGDTVKRPPGGTAKGPQPKVFISPVGRVQAEILPLYQPVVSLPTYQPHYSSSTPTPTATPSPTPTASQTISVSLSVPGRVYSINVAPGSTVLAVLDEARKVMGLTYSTEDFGQLGKKITEINGLREGNGLYWFYKINGAFASKGVSSQTVSQGDLIEWELKNS